MGGRLSAEPSVTAVTDDRKTPLYLGRNVAALLTEGTSNNVNCLDRCSVFVIHFGYTRFACEKEKVVAMYNMILRCLSCLKVSDHS